MQHIKYGWNNEIENINMFHSQSSIDMMEKAIYSICFFIIKSQESESPNVKQSNQKVTRSLQWEQVTAQAKDCVFLLD